MIKCRVSFTFYPPGYLTEKTSAGTLRISIVGDKRRVIEAIEENIECEPGTVQILHVQPIPSRLFRRGIMPRNFDYE